MLSIDLNSSGVDSSLSVASPDSARMMFIVLAHPFQLSDIAMMV